MFLRLDYGGLELICLKTVISQSFIKGITRAIHQTKGIFFFFEAIQIKIRSDLFTRKYKLRSYFFTFIF